MSNLLHDTYEILEELGSGGGGIVYLGRHLRLNQLVVLKADRRSLRTSEAVLRREVESLKNVNHHYLPRVYDYFIENDRVYTVIDYISGESFDKYLKRGEKFSQSQVVQWAKQLLQALDYLHSRPPHGILHADIKPANIMLTAENDIRLIDFNIALVLGEEGAIAVGKSFGYASPEHYRSTTTNQISIETPTIEKNNSESAIDEENIETVIGDECNETEIEAEYKETSIGNTNNKSEIDEKNDDETEIGEENDDDTSVEIEKFIKILSVTDHQSKITNSSTSGTRKSNITTEGESTSSQEKMWLDRRSDIYGLGATLYHLITGNRPARNAEEVEKITTEGVNAIVIEILEKAMDPDPEKRFQSADEMLYALEHLPKNDPRSRKLQKVSLFSNLFCATVFLMGGYSTYIGLSRMETTQSSKTLSAYSTEALAMGNVDLALEYALEALPTPDGKWIPEYTAQGQFALTEALRTYDFSESYHITNNINMENKTLAIAISPQGKTAVVITLGILNLISMENGTILGQFPMVESALSEAIFVNEETLFFAGKEGVTLLDLETLSPLWVGEKGTNLSVSGNGSVFSSIFKNENLCYVYEFDGNLRMKLDFGTFYQSVPENDQFTHLDNNIFTLNQEGSRLAISFSNGGLFLLDVTPNESMGGDLMIMEESDYSLFSGGFSGNYFAFSRSKMYESQFSIIDCITEQETGGFTVTNPITVKTTEDRIYLSNENVVVTLDPVTGQQTEAAYTGESDVNRFYVAENHWILALTEDYGYSFFDEKGNLLKKRLEGDSGQIYGAISNHSALLGSLDSTLLKLMTFENFSTKDFATYDQGFSQLEARISTDEKRVMYFNLEKIRICDRTGQLLGENTFDEEKYIVDQLFIRDTQGDYLEIIYDDGSRTHFSGETGEIIDEFQGIPLDSSLEECHETDFFIFKATLHGNIQVYLQDSGEFYQEIENQDYLTYVTSIEENFLLEFLSTDGSRYGMIYNKYLEPLAKLPHLCDNKDGYFYFDYGKGQIKREQYFSIEELLEHVKK